VEQALQFAREALALASRLHELPNVAEAHMWLGRIADKLGDHEGADREFAQAIHGLEQLGSHERLFRCHGLYAEVLERRGDVSRAYVHMKKALQATRPGLLDSDREDAEQATTA
jgi:tetratricopeptide (TPR) repeat protein